MDASMLAGMQEALNDVTTMMTSVVDLAIQVRERALAAGFDPETADAIAEEAFRVTLAISFPSTRDG